jgi:hypothetical protein
VCVVNKESEKSKKEKVIVFLNRMEKMRTTPRPSTTMNVPRRLSSKRSSRARVASPSVPIDDDRPDLVIQQSMDQISVRNVFGLLEKYDKLEMCELLATRDTHWLLTNGDVYKV